MIQIFNVESLNHWICESLNNWIIESLNIRKHWIIEYSNTLNIRIIESLNNRIFENIESLNHWIIEYFLYFWKSFFCVYFQKYKKYSIIQWFNVFECSIIQWFNDPNIQCFRIFDYSMIQWFNVFEYSMIQWFNDSTLNHWIFEKVQFNDRIFDTPNIEYWTLSHYALTFSLKFS